MEKISILRVMKKKKWTHPRFLHRGPKKAVEQDSDVHFDLTWAKKKETVFIAKNGYFSLKNGIKWNVFDFFFTETSSPNSNWYLSDSRTILNWSMRFKNSIKMLKNEEMT